MTDFFRNRKLLTSETHPLTNGIYHQSDYLKHDQIDLYRSMKASEGNQQKDQGMFFFFACRIPWSIGASVWVFLQQLWLGFMFLVLAVLELESKVGIQHDLGRKMSWLLNLGPRVCENPVVSLNKAFVSCCFLVGYIRGVRSTLADFCCCFFLVG